MATNNIADSGEYPFRRKLAQALLMGGASTAPVGHPLGAVARALQGLVGGELAHEDQAALKNEVQQALDMVPTADGSAAPAAVPGGYRPAMTPQEVAKTLTTQPKPDYRGAISNIESGGKYDALGPVTQAGDRAYGRYQVMGQNIPAWTKEVLGQEMTPEQFVTNPKAQDAVFDAKFGGYVRKYGNPQDAASAWFTGKPLAEGGNAADQNGMTGARYVQNFNAGLPSQVSTAPALARQPTPAPSGLTRAQLARMLANRYTAPAAMAIIAKTAENRFVPKNPSYGQIGTTEYGDPTYGWINPQDRTVTPVNVGRTGNGSPLPGGQPQESLIPPAPTGVDPKVWRAEWSKREAEREARTTLGASPDYAAKLRNEVRTLPSYKNLAEVAPRINAMVDAVKRDNRASDLTLVYGLMKILDPTSVVRESEVSMAQNVATIPQAYRAQVQSFLNGTGRLPPAVREAILQEAGGVGKAYRSQFDTDVSQYRGIAQRNKLSPEDIIPTFGDFNIPAAPAATPDVPAGVTLNDIDAELARRGVNRM